eukprot:4688184-Alexandrium_andersonii.AAC.1
MALPAPPIWAGPTPTPTLPRNNTGPSVATSWAVPVRARAIWATSPSSSAPARRRNSREHRNSPGGLPTSRSGAT